MKNYQVSIVVPIYGGEQYISRCARSLFDQDFENIEYIFVNDFTPDSSMGVLEKVILEYPIRNPDINIIQHKENKGLGSARNTGLKECSGRYVIHIDQDDWCELDMISGLYAKAIETDADIVACDYFRDYIKKSIYIKQSYEPLKDSNLAKILSGVIAPVVWNKLIKRDLYIHNNIYPPTQISVAEDYWLTIRLFVFANNIAYIPKAFLHYRQDNSNSLTANITPLFFSDLKYYAETTADFLKKKGLYKKYEKYFLMGNLRNVIYASDNKSYKNNINYVLPKADKLKYLWQLPEYSFFKKIIYSFMMLRLGFITEFTKKIYFKIKGFK